MEGPEFLVGTNDPNCWWCLACAACAACQPVVSLAFLSAGYAGTQVSC